MKKEDIKTGKITEKELVELFGSDAVKKSYSELEKFKGHQKNDTLKKISRYCDIKDLGNRIYKINKVYDYPLPSNFNKMNKSLYKYIVPLVLNSLINGHDKNNSIEIEQGLIPFTSAAKITFIKFIDFHPSISSFFSASL